MVTLEELRRKHKELVEGKKEGEGNNFASFTKERNIVRFLPGKDEPLNFYVEIASHKVKLPDGKFKTYQCRRSHNEDCPICNLMYDLWDMHSALSLKKGEKSKYGTMAATIKPRPRFFLKGVVRDLEAAGEQPVKIIAASQELFDRIMAAVTNDGLQDEDDPENTTILSLDRGNDFAIVITKKGDYNSFVQSEPIIKKTKAGTPAKIAEWMDYPINLHDLVKLEDYDELKLVAQNILASLDSSVKVESTASAKTSDDDDNSTQFTKGLQS